MTFDALRTPPSYRTGLVLAILAALAMVAGIFAPGYLVSASDTDETITRAVLGGNIIALLAFIPLLLAVHTLMGARANPPWMVGAAIAVLLVRPAILAIEFAAAPDAVFTEQWQAIAALATTGIAAALFAAAVVPDMLPVHSTGRLTVVAIGIGVLTFLALFAFSPYAAPVAAIGVAVSLAMNRGRSAAPVED